MCRLGININGASSSVLMKKKHLTLDSREIVKSLIRLNKK